MSSQEFSPAENRAMELALDTAKLGYRGANPLVGAAVLDSTGEVLSIGYHSGAGSPHAEIDALANLRHRISQQQDLSDCTMVVTLEPCNHHGRTGPCAAAILDAGIGNVIYAAADPTPEATGGGGFLRQAGIGVRSGLLQERALELNHRWFQAKSDGRPFTTMHIAQTLDGLIAAPDGTSQWITSAESRQDSHGIRGRVGAIIAGTGTVLADDPRLTARDESGAATKSQPLRVVMGLRDVPEHSAIRGDDGRFVHLRTHDPAEVLGELAKRGVGHAMVEGGAAVAGAFLQADLVDELVLYLAPMLLGDGTRSTGDLGIRTLAEASQWRWDNSGGGRTSNLGADLRLHLEPMPHGIPSGRKGL
jgi:diaminohydroxyphosphoribosylaminopyrimidine deaminase/5-amino-6-(5-phosphoribosylamino)uracil reductase